MANRNLFSLALCVFVSLAASAQVRAAQSAQMVSLDVEGTQFKATLSDGRVLYSPDLVGATLTIAGAGGETKIRIEAVEPDPGDNARAAAPSSEVLLHTFSYRTPEGEWKNLCDPGPDGRRQGFPLAGRARRDGTIAPAEPGVFELTCTGGAQGKCVRFGYHPWKTRDGAPTARALYDACVRLVRADYAGDGEGTTRNGQPIDIYDLVGVQSPGNDPAHEFEAGFSPEGAVCVRHVRVRENASLEALAAGSLRLKGRTGAICTEEFARANGAILFVRSPP
ncbi:ADYC domain-containing protein [Methylosinus sporium]|uniref:ADYC domain-containing protein n=1 Tax=Methylosinus sporium TaxID=428 RepID=UPI003839D4A9